MADASGQRDEDGTPQKLPPTTKFTANKEPSPPVSYSGEETFSNGQVFGEAIVQRTSPGEAQEPTLPQSSGAASPDRESKSPFVDTWDSNRERIGKNAGDRYRSRAEAAAEELARGRVDQANQARLRTLLSDESQEPPEPIQSASDEGESQNLDAFVLFNERESAVEGIVQELTNRGISTYFWRRDIEIGEEWERTEATQLRNARVVLLFMGEQGWGPNHSLIAARAQALLRPIIVVMVGEPPREAYRSLGGFLVNRRYLDLKVVTAEKVDQLVTAIRKPREELPRNLQPYGNQEDFRAAQKTCLKADIYADVLARIIVGLGNRDSFCFALLGPWGRGKTYLMRLVEDRLKPHDFSIVTFSAWKYRTTPELWAHLYETLRRRAEGDLLLPLRIGVSRRGVWPATLALFGLAGFLSTFAQKWNILGAALSVFSVSGVAFIAAAVYQLVKTGIRLHGLYWQMPRHQDRLGLQFAIGEDLKSLLQAWMPKPWTFAEWKSFFTPRRILDAVGYVVALSAVWWQMTQSAEQVAKDNLYHALADLGLLLVILLAGAATPLLISLKSLRRQNRILLVVDDLDRCHPDQMLEIIECLQLFLDEDGIKERLKLAMLVEEEILENAIRRKYLQVLARPNNYGRAASLWDSRLVRDNLEKLFLLWLRLPRLSAPELQEMFEGVCDPLSSPDQTQLPQPATAKAAASQVTAEPVSERPGVVEAPSSPATTVPPTEKLVKLRPEERDALTDMAAKLFSHDHHHDWGPRAVRSFVFRYQLARLLLTRLEENQVQPIDLVQALYEARDSRLDKHPHFDDHLWRIARQVS